ncbi:V-type proton ATPase subunit C [Caligus rogercresseyi]|uniref:V-type proton ATPase subunit C n=1 Tax=Caligus rogercresseyi TaxID=217165 RepID=A0A7T8HGH4_CALRO|nr:V-type proton ATPase subunit C [Caligus rogercresseyi]
MRVQVIQNVSQLLLSLLLGKKQHGLKVDRQAKTKNGLNKNSECLNMDARDKGFAKIDPKPSHL